MLTVPRGVNRRYSSFRESQGLMQTRRFFMGSSALTAASAARVMGAADRVRVGVVGSGSRGQWVMTGFLRYDCAVPAICDVYRPNAEKAAANVSEATGGKAELSSDYRRVMERKDIDVVLIATPDHWHCPLVIAACEAGKDVYVEKPLSNAIEPCFKAVAAARRYNRIVQVGVQQRSTPHFQDVARMLKEGLLGRIYHAPMLYPGGYGRRATEPGPVPEGLDWEMFQGPAERHPYFPARQRSWRGFYDYGGGLVTDWGVHLVDVVHWYLDDDMPLTASASAQYTRTDKPDREQPPDTFSISWTYAKYVSTFSNWAPNWNPPEVPVGLSGNYFVGERGTLFINRGGYIARASARRSPAGGQTEPAFEPVNYRRPRETEKIDEGTRLHVRNFLDCVKSRQKPNAEIEIGFKSTLPCLLGLLAIRNGRMYSWDGKQARAV